MGRPITITEWCRFHTAWSFVKKIFGFVSTSDPTCDVEAEKILGQTVQLPNLILNYEEEMGVSGVEANFASPDSPIVVSSSASEL